MASQVMELEQDRNLSVGTSGAKTLTRHPLPLETA